MEAGILTYAEYNGLRPYIDVRMEVFFKKQNHKKDIWDEFLKMWGGKIYYKKFLEKYDFDYLIVEKSDNLYALLKNDNMYKQIFQNKKCIVYKNE